MEGRVHWRIARFYRQQLIVQRVIKLRLGFRELIQSRRALTAGLQGVRWIFLNYQLMAMFVADKTEGVVLSNDPTEVAKEWKTNASVERALYQLLLLIYGIKIHDQARTTWFNYLVEDDEEK